jgi:hypothetical protein
MAFYKHHYEAKENTLKATLTLMVLASVLALFIGCATDDNPISTTNEGSILDSASPFPPPEPPPEPDSMVVGDFRTQTQGGWGTGCHGNNPGCYRDANFAGAFPNGLIAGCGIGYVAIFTTSEAVEDFLPAGRQPGALNGNYVDPGRHDAREAGVLLGQTVALALNIGFDAYDEDFGASDTDLADLVVVEGCCEGMTVEEVLEIANDFLGGCYTGSLSASQINECASAINENFVDGNMVGDYLELP